MEAARAAVLPDLPAIVELAQGMADEIRSERGGVLWLVTGARPEPIEAAIRALIERPDAQVIVGTIDHAVVGFATVEIEPVRDGTCIGVVRDLFVEPDARAVGVGEAIAEQIVAFCTQTGYAGIDAFALPGARRTKNFFERSGFVARALIMHKPL